MDGLMDTIPTYAEGRLSGPYVKLPGVDLSNLLLVLQIGPHYLVSRIISSRDNNNKIKC